MSIITSIKGPDVKKNLNRLSIRVVEEVEDKETTNLEEVFKLAQEIYELKIRNENIINVKIPSLLKIRQKRFFSWLFLITLYFALLILPAVFLPSASPRNMDANREMIIINAVIFLPMFVYFFYRSPYKQLKKVLKISNKEIMKQIK